MENDHEKVKEELKILLEQLKDTVPVDSQGNPFVLLPSKELKEIKKTIEEFAEEFSPNLKDS